jgi:DNA-binding NtrC family response regulator
MGSGEQIGTERSEPESGPGPHERAEVRTSPRRVLVLDDNKQVCEALVDVLQRAGYAVEFATEPHRALDLVAEFRPEVLVTDVKMPSLDGFTVLEHARRIDPTLSVVVMTGFATVPDAVRAMQSGAEHYVAKPFEADELLAVIVRALARREGRTAVAVAAGGESSSEGPPVPGATFAEIERHAILSTYEACGHNVLRTAATLGISPRSVHYRLREYRGEPGRRRLRVGTQPTDDPSKRGQD